MNIALREILYSANWMVSIRVLRALCLWNCSYYHFTFLFKVLTRLSVVWDQRRCHNTKSCKVILLSCNDIKCPSIVRTQKYMFITETDILISLSIYILSEGTLCDQLIDCFCVKSEINKKKMQTQNSWKWNNLVWYLRTYFSNLAVWGLFCMTCAWKK